MERTISTVQMSNEEEEEGEPSRHPEDNSRHDDHPWNVIESQQQQQQQQQQPRQLPCISKDYQLTFHNVTNHAFNSNPCIPVVNGYSFLYSCESSENTGSTNTNDTLSSSLSVSFSYQVWLADSGQNHGIASNLLALAWNLLYNVAVDLGLDSCQSTGPILPPNRRQLEGAALDSSAQPQQGGERGLLQQRRRRNVAWNSTSTNEVVQIVALSNENLDGHQSLENALQFTCQVPPSTVMAQNALCLHVSGSMRANFTPSHTNRSDITAMIQSFLQDEIAKQMSRSTILIDDVVAVQYIGSTDNSTLLLTPGGGGASSSSSSSTLNTSGLAIGITTAALSLVLLAMFFLVQRRRRSKARSITADEKEDDWEYDEENPQRILTFNSTEVSSSTSGSWNEDWSEDDDSIVSLSSSKTVDPCLLTQVEPLGEETDSLPVVERMEQPLPPPRQSSSSQRRRRKKKKKKKNPRVIRISSRSTLDDKMETIVELEESNSLEDEYEEDEEEDHASADQKTHPPPLVVDGRRLDASDREHPTSRSSTFPDHEEDDHLSARNCLWFKQN